jgi:hypothetical protein
MTVSNGFFVVAVVSKAEVVAMAVSNRVCLLVIDK